MSAREGVTFATTRRGSPTKHVRRTSTPEDTPGTSWLQGKTSRNVNDEKGEKRAAILTHDGQRFEPLTGISCEIHNERFVQTEPTAELWMQSASSQAEEPERRARDTKKASINSKKQDANQSKANKGTEAAVNEK